jgi:butyrate kinase
MKKIKVLSINPGSTSTKIAVFENEELLFEKNIKHSADDLKNFKLIIDQYQFRKNLILQCLKEAEIELDEIDAIVGRGGLLKPMKSGVYEVNQTMLQDLKQSINGQHASNLGGILADDIAKNLKNTKAFIADPVVVDELQDLARISGHPNFKRISIFHALNHKAIARAHAKSVHSRYEDLNLIVAHLGGGISVGAHQKGKVIDVNQALDGDGPFSPERSGSVPVGDLIKLCFSKKYTEAEVSKMIIGQGGYIAYLGTNNAAEVEKMVLNNDTKATLYYNAMAYQIAKEIGSMATVLHGKVSGILITGGIAYDKNFVSIITKMVDFIAPVFIYPGEDEMKALATNGFMVLRGEVEALIY